MPKNNIFLTIQLLINIHQNEGKSQVEVGKITKFFINFNYNTRSLTLTQRVSVVMNSRELTTIGFLMCEAPRNRMLSSTNNYTVASVGDYCASIYLRSVDTLTPPQFETK